MPFKDPPTTSSLFLFWGFLPSLVVTEDSLGLSQCYGMTKFIWLRAIKANSEILQHVKHLAFGLISQLVCEEVEEESQ